MTNVLERFPYWKTSAQHKREVQRELYKVLVSREERRRVGDWLKTEKSIEDHEPLKLNIIHDYYTIGRCTTIGTFFPEILSFLYSSIKALPWP